MALVLPELLKNILNFLAKDDALYPTLLVSRLWSMCAGPILWSHIELTRWKQREKFIKMININPRSILDIVGILSKTSYPTSPSLLTASSDQKYISFVWYQSDQFLPKLPWF